MKTSARLLILVFPLLVSAAAAFGDASYAAADQHALSAPASASASTDRLAAYLAQGMTTDTMKARSLYRWITNNIAYDTDAFFYGARSSQGAGDVLVTHKGVCAGYSGLFEELASKMGLVVVTVSGYAKGYAYAPGTAVSGSNHDWNAVKIDGVWHLIDSTWGAGYVGDDRRFVKEYTDFFFFASPDQMILSHLPEDPQWQLLATPWTSEQFMESVFVYPDAYSLGISAHSHLKALFTSTGRERLVFDAPSDVVAIASVDDNDALALTQTIPGGFEVLCAFPTSGKHTLSIYAAKIDAAQSYSGVMEYIVQATAGVGDAAYFPDTYNNFGPRGITLIAPLSGRLAGGTTVDFSLTVPKATKVSVISGGTWTALTRTGESFTGSVSVTAGDVQVCAAFPDKSGYEGLMSYRAQ
jgi:hypothetical protein